MGTQVESLWIFALASSFTHLSFPNILTLAFLLALAWFLLCLSYWAHPGGPAWGRYGRKKAIEGHDQIPGPKGFPIIGSIRLMSGLAHHKLAAAAKRFKASRLMAISLGDTRVLITCHPDVAKEILNSPVFADRPIKESAYGLMFNRAIGFAPYGAYWRTLRRIAATHLFCPRQINGSAMQRAEMASQMVSMMAGFRGTFHVRDVLKRASLCNMMCSVFGRGYKLNETCEETLELRELVEQGYDLLGKLNWADHLPWLAGLDLQKVRFCCNQLVPRVNRFVSRIIREHRERSHEKSHDFVDVLLSLRGPDKLDDSDMVAVLWEMIFRGTDTVAVLIEWILARMVLHPDVQSKIQEELDQVVGRSRPLMESDVQSLAYLQAVIKEVLRLHPPGPLLSWARLAITDTTVDGYHVPAGTTAMVNMWAITRDPTIWENPLEFIPERFLARDADVEFPVFGSDLRLAPFGSGRRVCPGKGLGLATATYWTARLLHEFKWAHAGTGPVDLSEVLRLSCEMASPLCVKVTPRCI